MCFLAEATNFLLASCTSFSVFSAASFLDLYFIPLNTNGALIPLRIKVRKGIINILIFSYILSRIILNFKCVKQRSFISAYKISK